MLYFLITIIFVILLCPIPLKIKIKYTSKKLEFFIYNKKIERKSKSNNTIKKKNLLYNLTKKINKEAFNKLFKQFHISKLLKPKLKINYVIFYGTEDASDTAIVYGIINMLPSFIYKFLSLFFKIKNYNYNITPIFNNKIINFKINCIITLNITKIILIMIKFSILVLKLRRSDNKWKAIQLKN